MSINYPAYIRRRIESLGASLHNNALDHQRNNGDEATVAWMLETAQEILELCARMEPEEWRYRYLEPTAPKH